MGDTQEQRKRFMQMSLNQRLFILLKGIQEVLPEWDELAATLTEEERAEAWEHIHNPPNREPAYNSFPWIEGGVKLVLFPGQPLPDGRQRYTVCGCVITHGPIGGLSYNGEHSQFGGSGEELLSGSSCCVFEAYRNQAAAFLEALDHLHVRPAKQQGRDVGSYCRELNIQ